MGLASSQARLLNLTSRMHDIEYKAQKLEAQKLQMANESTQVYQEYENALNTTKLQLKKINDDGSAAYVDASYENLTEAGYYVTMLGTGLNTNASKLIVTSDDETLFKSSAVNSPEKFAAVKSGMCEVKQVNTLESIVLKDTTNTVCIFTVDDLDKYEDTNTTKILMNDLVINKKLGTLKGTLDGNGHTITVNSDNALFNALKDATIKNLNLDLNINATSDATTNVGGLGAVAEGDVTIENVNLTGSITSTSTKLGTLGSLIGSCNDVGANLVIKNVSSYVDINQNADSTSTYGPFVGGLVGQYINNASTNTITIQDSTYSGTISTVDSGLYGGLIGYYAIGNDSSNKGTGLSITNCATSGAIVSAPNASENNRIGCIIGQISNNDTTGTERNQAYNFSNNESSMNIVAGTNQGTAGGVMGLNYNGGTPIGGTISNNYTKNVTYSGGGTYEEIFNGSGAQSSSTSTCTATGAKTSTSHDHKESSQYNYYLKIGEAIKSGNYIVAENYKNVNNSTWLSEMLNSAYILLSKMDSDNNVFEVNVATDTSLQEVSDETLLKKAEAKYEADMRKINQKDKKFDTELAAMDAERNAVKTEMDTLKSVAKENVDRTFKLFG